jgi:hypothetical protein
MELPKFERREDGWGQSSAEIGLTTERLALAPPFSYLSHQSYLVFSGGIRHGFL